MNQLGERQLSRRKTLRLLGFASGGIALAGMVGCTSAMSNTFGIETSLSIPEIESKRPTRSPEKLRVRRMAKDADRFELGLEFQSRNGKLAFEGLVEDRALELKVGSGEDRLLLKMVNLNPLPDIATLPDAKIDRRVIQLPAWKEMGLLEKNRARTLALARERFVRFRESFDGWLSTMQLEASFNGEPLRIPDQARVESIVRRSDEVEFARHTKAFQNALNEDFIRVSKDFSRFLQSIGEKSFIRRYLLREAQTEDADQFFGCVGCAGGIIGYGLSIFSGGWGFVLTSWTMPGTIYSCISCAG